MLECKCLHEHLWALPMVKHPFKLEDLPENRVYFFYEEGETWGHGGDEPRVVRVGTHRGQGNLRSRMSRAYVLDERKLDFGQDQHKPADWSIFRKNLGRALLNRAGDDYLQVWKTDFIPSRNRERLGHLRDVEKEGRLEQAISALLRDRFCFRVIPVESQT